MAKAKPQTETSPKDKAASAAIELAATRLWRDLTLADIATAAGLSLSDLYPLSSVDDLLPEIDRQLDRTLSDGPMDETMPPRERLFEVVMRRFDAMEEARAGHLSRLAYVGGSPVRKAGALMRRHATAKWALVSASLDAPSSSTLLAPARIAALAWVIERAEKAWTKEESSDLSRTMAALDKGLRDWEERLDRMAKPFDFANPFDFAKRKPKDDPTPEGEPEAG